MKINISIIDEVTGAGTSDSFNTLEEAQVFIGKKLGIIPEEGFKAPDEAPVESTVTEGETAGAPVEGEENEETERQAA